MMENREQIIKDCETMRRALTDFAELDAEIERQLEETQVVAELVFHALWHQAAPAIEVKPGVRCGGSYARVALVTVRVESAGTQGEIFVDF